MWDEEEVAGGPDEITPSKDSGEASPGPADIFAGAGGQMVPLREVERQMIRQALKQTDNNRTHAARMLGISVRTLRNKLNEYRSQGIEL